MNPSSREPLDVAPASTGWPRRYPCTRFAADLAQELCLLEGLYPLGNDPEVEGAAHGDDGGGDRRVVGVGGDITDEGTVDLERVHREVLEVGE
jgi:hypothetical protein